MNPPLALLLALGLLLAPWLLETGRRYQDVYGIRIPLWWINASYCAFLHRFRRPDLDPLPPHGPAILICNHTSGIDHMLLQASTRRALGFVIAKELYDVPLHKTFCSLVGCIPVKRDGRDLTATRATLRALGEGRVIPIFPEGHIIPTSGRVLGPGKPGVAYLATTARVPVIPAYLWGTPESNQFARSIWMPSYSHVLFGPPVDLSDYLAEGKIERDRLGEVTERLMAAIAALRERARLLPDGPAIVDDPPNEMPGAPDGPRPEPSPGAVSGLSAAVD